ncbi:DNA internalization-related competence protein ComEC/Rec2 [Niallia circulans]|uniref:DNA internalization-related competence protein ComEC/Rec2 n=1 Tax=Niallia circulans TaxID=1397 RepID=UPI0022A65CEC|nr:DNA internalization-related competence protein ComEC/Rec2 [Niallia circulans]
MKPSPAANEGMFDYNSYLTGKSIHWLLEVERKGFSSCEQTNFHPLYFILMLREKGISWINTVFTEQTAPVAIALLFGDRDYMAGDIQTAYQKIGIVHLLAISGSHVILLIGMSYYGLLRIGVTRQRSITILMFFLPAYTILTGLSPSVIRAVSTAMLVLIQKKWQRTSYSSIDLLSIAFVIYLFLFPRIVHDIGFQLSFVVSLFLLLSTTILKQKEKQRWKMYILTAYFCELSVLPFLLIYFHELPVLSLLANLVYIPFYSVLLPYCIIVFLLSMLFVKMTTLFLYPLDQLSMLSDWLALTAAKLPHVTMIFGKPDKLELLLYILLIPLFFYLYEAFPDKRKSIFLIPLSLLLFQHANNVWSPYGEVAFINVGQGDSVLIHEPYNQGTYLIDTGGTVTFQQEKWAEREDRYEVGEDTLVPYLKSKGISKIDKLILTHGDLDHIGGSTAVIENLHVEQILMAKTNWNLTDGELGICKLAKQKNIPVLFVESGKRWLSRDAGFQILAPIAGAEYSEGENDGSLVISARIGGITWLFTGDIEEIGEGMLLNKNTELKADILKVAHHGSKTSTTEAFLHAVDPTVAIISAGKNNSYGHPNKDVLERLHAKNITVWRTDLNGTISFKYSQKKGTFFLQMP